MTPEGKQSNEFRLRREQLRLSQNDIAARLGRSQMSVSNVERNKMLRGRVAREVARVLLELEEQAS